MSRNNVDFTEISKFSALAQHWWDPHGEMKSLHDINPLRLQYITSKVTLPDKKILDLGCGAGLLSESLAKAGAQVTGIDMSEDAIRVADLHQQESNTHVEYMVKTAEQIALERPHHYDVITCLEMLEHVPDPLAIVQSCATLLKPQGKIFFSTINRNIKAYLFAIVGAEYILKLLPKNTHDFAKFIRPSELARWMQRSELHIKDLMGLNYNMLTKKYYLSSDVSVNYLAYAEK